MSIFATLGGGFLGRPDGMLAGELVARHRITHSHGPPPARVTPLSDPASQTEALDLVARVDHHSLSLSLFPSFSLPIPLAGPSSLDTFDSELVTRMRLAVA